ncbi:MAG: M23 family metallopeptidase [Rhodobacteraceae bacterium]|nr:M23 family metallopeptidase [Paracoccaceae bacterium]
MDLAALDKGVAVKAAALGIVDRSRDGVPDTGVVAGVENGNCGNGIVIRNNDGFETQYCRLKNGSFPVKKGDVVCEGDIIGGVGFSGLTEFPHVHFTVRRDGELIDPFSPDQIGTCGQTADAGLWADDLPYQPGGLIRIGVAFDVPDYQTIKEGYLGETSLPQDASALVVLGYGFGARAADEVHIVVQVQRLFSMKAPMSWTAHRPCFSGRWAAHPTGWLGG